MLLTAWLQTFSYISDLSNEVHSIYPCTRKERGIVKIEMSKLGPFAIPRPFVVKERVVPYLKALICGCFEPGNQGHGSTLRVCHGLLGIAILKVLHKMAIIIRMYIIKSP